MYLKSILLQNFRNYTQRRFDFNPKITIITGPNTAGKTNLVEAVMLLSIGKSLRTGKDNELIHFGKEVAWVKGIISNLEQKEELINKEVNINYEKFSEKLEIIIAQGNAISGRRILKKHLVNGVTKSQASFMGFLPTVLFRPEELDIIITGPSLRRDFLDHSLEQTDKNYKAAKLVYEKALRQRNALLDTVRETGVRKEEEFKYWDKLLISNGSFITKKRGEFIDFMNSFSKDIINCLITYDKSLISEERLLQYKDQEIYAGVTLVGPHRDDFFIEINDNLGHLRNVKNFGSRGQQRLVILQLKIMQLQFLQNILKIKPLLVLDDIFSELDESHIELVMGKISSQQTIITTIHKEFINPKIISESSMIELNNERI